MATELYKVQRAKLARPVHLKSLKLAHNSLNFALYRVNRVPRFHFRLSAEVVRVSSGDSGPLSNRPGGSVLRSEGQNEGQ